MKKWLSVICVVLLLCAALAMPTSAATAPTLRMDGPVQATAGDTIKVALYVQGTIGGAEGDIVYDTNKLDYVRTIIRTDMQELGNTEDVTVNPDENTGKVRFVTLSNVAGGTAPADAWLTLEFTVKMATTGDQATVSLENVKASDVTGTASVAVENKSTVITLVDNSNLAVDVQGATIRTDGAGIRFQATATNIDHEGLVEAGIVMLPTALLYDGQDLTIDTVGKGNTTPAVAYTRDAAALTRLTNKESLFATLTASTINGRGNVAITARSYFKYSDGTVIYSHNDGANNVVDGAASKSVVNVAQAIATAEIAKDGSIATAEINAILAKTKLTDDEVAALITFCTRYIGLL